MKEHEELVARLAKSGKAIQETLDPVKCNMVHMAMGIAGEAGELLDAIKKNAIYGKTLNLENVMEELGDIEFYMQGLRAQLQLERDAILAYNIAKLTKRYGHRYSDGAAIARVDKAESSK